MSYPALVYRCPGQHFAHDGQTYSYAKANDEVEMSALLKAGWHGSLVDAVKAATEQTGDAVKAEDPDDEAPASRAELESMATELGLKFDGRTSDAGLLRKIDEALAETR